MSSAFSLTIRVRHREANPAGLSGSLEVDEATITSTVVDTRPVHSSIAGEIITTVLTEVAGPISAGVLSAWIYDRFVKDSDQSSISIDPSELLVRNREEIEQIISEIVEDLSQ